MASLLPSNLNWGYVLHHPSSDWTKSQIQDGRLRNDVTIIYVNSVHKGKPPPPNHAKSRLYVTSSQIRLVQPFSLIFSQLFLRFFGLFRFPNFSTQKRAAVEALACCTQQTYREHPPHAHPHFWDSEIPIFWKCAFFAVGIKSFRRSFECHPSK